MKIKIMKRHGIIIIFFLIIHFAGIQLRVLKSKTMREMLAEDVPHLIKLYEKENELFNRLTSYYENAANVQVPVIKPEDDTVFYKVYFHYTLFWVSVNLRLCFLVHNSNLIRSTDSSNSKNEIAEMYDSLFRITSEIFGDLKIDIRNYYRTMQNKEIICWSTSTDSDTSSSTIETMNLPLHFSIDDVLDVPRTIIGTAENIWEELLKLSLDFIMSTDDLEKTDFGEYDDGLVKWSTIKGTKEEPKSYKTLLPNNFPDKIEILNLSDIEYQYITYTNKSTSKTSTTEKCKDLQLTWYCKLMDFIDIDINEKILKCFFTKLIGSPLNKSFTNAFKFINCPDLKTIRKYKQKFSKGGDRMTTTIQMVRLIREKWIIDHIEFSKPEAVNEIYLLKEKPDDKKCNKFLKILGFSQLRGKWRINKKSFLKSRK